MSISYWEEHPTTRVTFPILAKVVQDQPSTLLPAEDEFLLSADIYVPGRRGAAVGWVTRDRTMQASRGQTGFNNGPSVWQYVHDCAFL